MGNRKNSGPLRTPADADVGPAGDLGFPLVDFHVHLEGFGLERALELSRKRGVRFGIVEHGGRGREIGSDEDLERYIQSLSGHPVYKGLQAEGLDWRACFSKEALSKLDYALADAMTFPDRDGRPVRLWRPEEVRIEDLQDFMDRYVEFNVRVLSEAGIDIFASPTYLPDCIADRYDALWTGARMERVIRAAVQNGVAIEINERYRIPSAAFIGMAKAAGARFSFGTNSHGEEAGALDHCLRMAEACGLGREHMFAP